MNHNVAHDGEHGFTLVELLVVIVILGVLAAIVVFAVGGLTDRGTHSAAAADQSYLEAAEEANFAKQTAYVSQTDLVAHGLLRTTSTVNLLCWRANDYLVTDAPGAVSSLTQSAADSACATAASAEGKTGLFTGSAGTVAVP